MTGSRPTLPPGVPQGMQVHVNDDADFAALYINGVLETADSFVAVVANVLERLNVGFVQDDAFIRGDGDEIAATLAEVAEFRRERDSDLARAEKLRREAEALEARYR